LHDGTEDEFVGVDEVGDLSELVAAEDGELAVHGDTLTAHVEAGGAAKEGEVDTRREVSTAEGVETDRAADGAQERGAVGLLAKSLVKEVDLDVVVDLAAPGEAEAALEGGGHVDLHAVLEDVDVSVVVHLLLLAEKTGAGVEDTLDGEAGLHARIDLRTVDDSDAIGVLGVENTASRSGTGLQRSNFTHSSPRKIKNKKPSLQRHRTNIDIVIFLTIL